ncbi:hypothetical protein AABB24_035854 [Solanum stoloniferum]|uniref:Exonuclease domain-containing protein n=1 Tax=Solanum stoloniferum TaxID=62892 RepID=A0ABD2R9B6_9SOLN
MVLAKKPNFLVLIRISDSLDISMWNWNPQKFLCNPSLLQGSNVQLVASSARRSILLNICEHLIIRFMTLNAVCNKHCKSFESLSEHIAGPLAKVSCSSVFAERGCILCLKICSSVDSLNEHKETCRLTTPQPIEKGEMHRSADEMINIRGQEVVAIDCVMVGGGWSQELCATVCLVDEDEKIIFQTHILPPTPVADYRYEITGITEKNLQDAMPLNEVRERIQQILYSGEPIGRVLVGHNLEKQLHCLKMFYHDHLLRDTATYQPLMKTNFSSHSLKYLTKTYLGYDIQVGFHDPY